MTHGLLPLGTFCPPLFDCTPAVFRPSQQPKPDRSAVQTPSVLMHVAESTGLQTLLRQQGAQSRDRQPTLDVHLARSSMSIAEHFSQAPRALESLARLGQRGRRQRQLDMERIWLAANRHRYSGRWIALDGDRLLADGASAREVFAEVANHTPAPLVIHIAEGEPPFAGW